MTLMGIQFGAHMIRFRRTEVLAEKRDEEITAMYKQRLVGFYQKYQDQGRQYASVLAYKHLIEMGIRISHRLAYFARPEKKIDDALIAKEQNLSERAYIDRSLFIYLSKFKGLLPFSVLEIFDSFAFRIVEDLETTLSYSEDFECITDMSTLPSYHEHDDFGKLFRRVGGVSRHSQFPNYKEYQSILSTLDGIGGSEIVVSESRKVLSKMKDKPYGVTLLMDYFAIPKHLLSSFTKIVMDDARMYFYTPYQSYVEAQAFMDIDNTTVTTMSQISPYTYLYNQDHRRSNKFIEVVQTHIRDLINSLISTLSYNPLRKVIVQFKPYSYGRWANFSKIDAKFSTRILSVL
jgi:hypothetical protein